METPRPPPPTSRTHTYWQADGWPLTERPSCCLCLCTNIKVALNGTAVLQIRGGTRIPRRRGANPPGSANIRFLPNFPKKNCMKLRKFWAEAEGCPLRSTRQQMESCHDQLSSYSRVLSSMFFLLFQAQILLTP